MLSNDHNWRATFAARSSEVEHITLYTVTDHGNQHLIVLNATSQGMQAREVFVPWTN